MTSTIRALIESTWRRRFLILTPILMLSIAGFVAAMFWPKLYASTTLMLLQEDGGSNPLSNRDEIVLDQRARVAALEALVKSDRVLSAVLTETLGDEVADPVAMAFQQEYLRSNIFVRLIGDQFVEIELFGPSPERAQLLLEALVGRTLESLLLPANAMLSAPDYLISQRRVELAEFQRASAELERQAGGLDPEDLTRKVTARIDAAQALTLAEAATARARADLGARLSRVLGPSDQPRSVSGVLQSIDAALAPSEDAPALAGPARAELEMQREAVSALLPAEERLRELIRAERAAQRTLDDAERAVADHDRLRNERDALTRQFQETAAEVDSFLERFRSQRATTLDLLRAPEQIRIVDAPSLPKVPATSALKILVAGIAAGLALGVGLAIVAEQLDQSVRGPDDVADAAAAPVLTRLSKVEPRRAARVGAPLGSGPPPAAA